MQGREIEREGNNVKRRKGAEKEGRDAKCEKEEGLERNG